MTDRVFEALSSPRRREILVVLAGGDMTVGAIASHFDMTKPGLSQHLSILERAGLVTRTKRGQFVHYGLLPTGLVGALEGFMDQLIAPARQVRVEVPGQSAVSPERPAERRSNRSEADRPAEL